MRTVLLGCAGLVAVSSLLPCGTYGRERHTVVFDEGHGQRFRIAGHDGLDLSGLADVFRAAGATVRSSPGEITDASLSSVDALVISGPFAAFTPAEIECVGRFLDRGGRLAVMLHIPFPVAPLLQRLRVDFSNGVIRERENLTGDEALNFRVTALTPHPLTRNLDSFSVFGAWALLSEDRSAVAVARTSPRAWVDLNNDNALGQGDAVQSFSVVIAGQAGSGRFAVFGDDAIFQNQFLTGGNAALARNLADWLLQADGAAQRS